MKIQVLLDLETICELKLFNQTQIMVNPLLSTKSQPYNVVEFLNKNKKA